MFSDEDLIAISGLQHLMFCERRWGLIHMEQEWHENTLTVEGKQLHEFVHEQGSGTRDGVRMARGLSLRSLKLGLYGIADLVEFHPRKEGAVLPNLLGYWLPYPIEYKHGRKRHDSGDVFQLCAQALCLEEMLNVPVHKGAVYYGKPRRRTEVELTLDLREEVERLCCRARELYNGERIPLPRTGHHCSSCSLEDQCMPNLTAQDESAQYIENILKGMQT